MHALGVYISSELFPDRRSYYLRPLILHSVQIPIRCMSCWIAGGYVYADDE